MAAGEICACIGLSEPGAGSDLAAVRSTARRTETGWRIDGQKLWTTNAHHAQIMIALVRSEMGSERNAGLSQFLIPMDAPGVTVWPIIDLPGAHEFNEVFFDDVELQSDRSEERRVGKACVCTCRSRGWTYHLQNKSHEHYYSPHKL